MAHNIDINSVFAETGNRVSLPSATYQSGWESITTNTPPTRQQFNAILNEMDRRAVEAYWRARNVYRDDISYLIGDVVYSNNQWYQAIANVTGTSPTQPGGSQYWGPASFAGGGGGSSFGSPGTVVIMASDNAPSGTLNCDGSIVSKADYNNLYNAIGNTFNNMSVSSGAVPATQFRIPDFRGRFLAGSGAGIMNFGFNPQEIPNHAHYVPRYSATNLPNVFRFNTSNAGGYISPKPGDFSQYNSELNPSGAPVETSQTVNGSTKNRPDSMAMGMFIVY